MISWVAVSFWTRCWLPLPRRTLSGEGIEMGVARLVFLFIECRGGDDFGDKCPDDGDAVSCEPSLPLRFFLRRLDLLFLDVSRTTADVSCLDPQAPMVQPTLLRYTG